MKQGDEERVPVPGSSLGDCRRHGKLTTMWERQNRICVCKNRVGIIRKD